MLIENSNQGVGGPAPAAPRNKRDNPTTADAPCPFNLFRTGGDIVPDFGVVISKLQRTVPYVNRFNRLYCAVLCCTVLYCAVR